MIRYMCIYTLGIGMKNEKCYKEASICHCTNMRRASRALSHLYDVFLKPSGLNVAQYALLNHLKRYSPINMSDLSRVIRLERTTLLRNLKPLIAQRLVTIDLPEHEKAKIVHLSPQGYEMLAMALPLWQEAQKSIAEHISKEELQTFLHVLQKIETITH